MRIPSGSTDRYLYFVAVDATDLKTRETGLSSFTVYRSRNGAAAAVFTTPTVNETDVSNMPGVYELLMDEDTTLDAGKDEQEMVVHITHAGMAPVTRAVEIYRPKATEGETVTATSGRANADVTHWGTTAVASAVILAAANIGADAITAAKLAADVTTELQSGLATAAALATAQTSIDDLPTNAELTTALGTADDAVLAQVALVKAKTDNLPSDPADQSLVIAATDALATLIGDVPTNAELATALGTADDAVLAQVALVKAVTDKVDDTLEDDGGTFRFTTNALEQAPTGGSAPTVGQIADEVQTRTIAAVTTVNGLAANTVNASALAADAVAEIQSGLATAAALATVDGIVDDILVDTAEIGVAGAGLTSRASQASVDDLPTNAELATALGTADDAVLAQVALVKAKTDLIPSDPADASDIASAFSTVNSTLATIAGFIDTEVAAIIAAIAAQNNISEAQVLTQVNAALQATLADSVPADGTRPSISSGVYMLVQFLLERQVSGTTVSVKKPDGSTQLFALTLDDATTPTSITRSA